MKKETHLVAHSHPHKIGRTPVIPLKHSESMQVYLVKSTDLTYINVEYGVFGKFRFMT